MIPFLNTAITDGVLRLRAATADVVVGGVGYAFAAGNWHVCASPVTAATDVFIGGVAVGAQNSALKVKDATGPGVSAFTIVINGFAIDGNPGAPGTFQYITSAPAATETRIAGIAVSSDGVAYCVVT